MKGVFITLEGSDGSGKTTISQKLKEHFKSRKDLVFTREPGGTLIGEKIREIILDPKNQGLCNEAEALLYAASRAQHIAEVIEPALERGDLVISDRYLLSSLAYQGVGRGLGIGPVYDINAFGLRGIRPDLVLFFQIDPEETLRRKLEETGGDRLEQAGGDFHKKVHQGYKDLLRDLEEEVVIIDANKSIGQVTDQAIGEIEKILKRRGDL